VLSKGRAVAAMAAAALGGCFGSYEEFAEETRAGLIGKTGHELRDCLGVPAEYDQKDGQEIMTYRWTFKPPPRPRVGPDSVLTRNEDPTRSNDPKDLGHCELVLLLGTDGVTQVTVHGRDPEGLSADSRCLVDAHRCVDEDHDEDQ
jgi:hypothetical protein